MNDDETTTLHDDMLAALDLLDQLVDPLLDVSVCKRRVVAWKQMARKLVEEAS